MMTEKHYKLTKISKTGYEFSTSDIEMVYDRLDEFVCTSCKVKRSEASNYCNENNIEGFEREQFIEEAFPDNYDSLPTLDKVKWLMSTDCGCEFMFEEFDSYHDYMVDKMEDVQDYFKRKQGKL
ncbi:hypothetical protein [Vibrio phage vB_VibM_10AMN]|uniref:Uncharacterized protein n=1 Tax=Staphylococcus phage vB_VibM_10AMN12 TaxID=3076785 RepID=A0AA96KTF8_9CAUD|nr:hypothetical protein [Vibrio phage vB_VibM_10AMN]WNO47399.1 hypothetical protein [Staphylococcus phage vB_VibM_10AMN12]